MKLSPDFRDLLTAFGEAGVRYLVVGGYAVGYHHRPRATKDLDLWVDSSLDNRERIAAALATFGVPPGLLEQVRSMQPDEIVYFGKPPLRVDLIASLSGLDFDDAFQRRITVPWEGVAVNVVGKADLIASKRRRETPRPPGPARTGGAAAKALRPSSSHGREPRRPSIFVCLHPLFTSFHAHR